MRGLAIVGLLLLAGCVRTSGPCPHLYEVDTNGPVWNGNDLAPITLRGDTFEVMPLEVASDNPQVRVPQVWLEASPRVRFVDVVWGSTTELSAALPLTDPPIEPGLYDVTVINPSGCSEVLADTVRITDVPPNQIDPSIQIDGITPPFGWTDAQTAVTIIGDGFVSSPRAYLDLDTSDEDDWAELEQVAFVDTTSLTAIVPRRLPVGGPYDLIVENPDQGWNLLRKAFTVTEDAPPDILTVFPEAGITQVDTPVAITGDHFDNNPSVTLVDENGDETDASVTSSTSTRIDAVVPSASMGSGAYLVRVTNGDDSYDDHAAFVVRNPSAKLGDAGAWELTSEMTQARARHGSVTWVDGLGRAWLYSVAGDAGDQNQPLKTAERAPIDAFGTLGEWQEVTRLGTARTRAAFAAIDGYIYAFGGYDGTAALDTIERAAILVDGNDQRPEIVDSDVEEGAGDLDAGTWYYRVSAVMDNADPDNPGGETLASPVEVVRARGNNLAITLGWKSVSGATEYRIYRSDEVDGVVGQEHMIEANVLSTRWTDEGNPPGIANFVPEGGLGVWVDAGTLPAVRMDATAVQATTPNGEDVLYLVGGTDNSALDGDVFMRRANGAWETAGVLTTPRTQGGADLATPERALELGSGSPDYLCALEGDDGGGATADVACAVVGSDGTLGTFTSLTRLDANGQARVSGRGLIAAGHMYFLGGGGTVGAAQASGRQSAITGPAMDNGSWSSTAGKGTLTVERGDFGLAPVRAFLFASGGYTSSETATASVEVVIY